MSDNRWPFEETPNTIALTTHAVTAGAEPIGFVSHDADDGMWQFHSKGPVSEDDAAVVALSEILSLDESIVSVANLPRGWCAWRETRTAPWQRAQRGT
jgi:hypothetical protein